MTTIGSSTPPSTHGIQHTPNTLDGKKGNLPPTLSTVGEGKTKLAEFLKEKRIQRKDDLNKKLNEFSKICTEKNDDIKNFSKIKETVKLDDACKVRDDILSNEKEKSADNLKTRLDHKATQKEQEIDKAIEDFLKTINLKDENKEDIKQLDSNEKALPPE